MVSIQKQIKGKKVKCEHCGYEWYTKTNLIYVSCPSCLRKVKVGR